MQMILREHGIPAEVGWNYRELEIQCVDSMMARAFMKMDFDESYSASCLQENIKRIAAMTWEKISATLVVHAKDAGIETGKCVRIDATGIESDVHTPTDSSLLFDCIRSINLQFEHLRSYYGLKVYSPIKTGEGKSLFVRIFNAKTAEVREDLYRLLIRAAKKILLRAEQVLESKRLVRLIIDVLFNDIAFILCQKILIITFLGLKDPLQNIEYGLDIV